MTVRSNIGCEARAPNPFLSVQCRSTLPQNRRSPSINTPRGGVGTSLRESVCASNMRARVAEHPYSDCCCARTVAAAGVREHRVFATAYTHPSHAPAAVRETVLLPFPSHRGHAREPEFYRTLVKLHFISRSLQYLR